MIVAAVALAAMSLWAEEIPKEIVVSSGGYDYRLIVENFDTEGTAKVIGETEGYRGVRLPTVAGAIEYYGPRGWNGRYHVWEPPEGMLCGDGEIVIEGSESRYVVHNTEYRNRSQIRRVTISGIRAIYGADLISDWGGAGAFAGCPDLLYVDFSDNSLQFIGMNCFSDCVNLREIVIPDSVNEIENHTFRNCYSVTNIVIGSGLSVIYEDQFNAPSTTNLQSVTINGNGHTVLAGSEDWTLHRGGRGTFHDTAVRKVVLRGVASIGIGEAYAGVFDGCTNLTELEFADNCLTNIASASFRHCRSLGRVTLPEGLQRLGRNAFFNCTSLTNIDFGTGSYSIDADVFQDCTALKRADLTANITSYGARGTGSIFSGCTNLTYLRVGPGVKTVTSQILPPINAAPNEVLIDGDGTVDLTGRCFADSHIRKLTLKGVRSIGYDTFWGCKLLETLDFDNSPLESIGRSAFRECVGLGILHLPDAAVTVIDGEAFRSCTALTNFTFGSGEYTFVDGGHFMSCSALRDVRFLDGVKNLGNSMFGGCAAITNIWIGCGVTNIADSFLYPKGDCESWNLTVSGAGETVIGAFAFANSNVRAVRLEGVREIGDEAFNRCPGLESITFGNCPKLTRIGVMALANVPKLSSLALPNAVCTTIEEAAFAGDSSLANLTFGTGEYRIVGGGNFSGCTSLTSVDLPDRLYDIADYAFYRCDWLKRVTIPSCVTNIGTKAFEDCEGLEAVTLPSDLKRIGAGAFGGCSGLKELTIPSGVTEIGERAFWGCDGVESATVSEGVTEIGETFSGFSGLKSISLPSTLKSLDARAFDKCTSLTSVTIPSGVTNVSEYAFSNCDNLEKVTVSEGVTDIGRSLSRHGSLTSVKLPSTLKTIGDRAFDRCVSLAELAVPSNVTSIGAEAFSYCRSFESFEIPPSVTSIGDSAFANCDSLRALTIPPSVEEFGSWAFYGDDALREVYVAEGDEERIEEILQGSGVWGVRFLYIGVPTCLVTFDACGGELYEESYTAMVGRPIGELPEVMHDDWTFVGWFTAKEGGDLVTPQTVPEGDVTYFAQWLTNEDFTWLYDTWDGGIIIMGTDQPPTGALNIPAVLDGCPVTAVDGYAFQDCVDITSVTIPGTVTYIGEGAFGGCVGLANEDGFVILNGILFCYAGEATEVRVPAGVTRIDGSAFSGNETIESVTIPYGVTELGSFSGCSALASVSLPESVTVLPSGLFEYCSALKSIRIPSGVTYIGYRAFYSCENLQEVKMTCRVAPDCDENAFYKSWSVIVYVPRGSTGWNGDPTSMELPVVWKNCLLSDYELSVGYSEWTKEQGLVGAEAAWDAKPARWGGEWENAFVYTFGEGLASGANVFVRLTFDSDRRPIVTTAPIVPGHQDFTIEVVGTPDLKDWTNPVPLNCLGPCAEGEEWILPQGEEAQFFRVRLSEKKN